MSKETQNRVTYMILSVVAEEEHDVSIYSRSCVPDVAYSRDIRWGKDGRLTHSHPLFCRIKAEVIQVCKILTNFAA